MHGSLEKSNFDTDQTKLKIKVHFKVEKAQVVCVLKRNLKV